MRGLLRTRTYPRRTRGLASVMWESLILTSTEPPGRRSLRVTWTPSQPERRRTRMTEWLRRREADREPPTQLPRQFSMRFLKAAMIRRIPSLQTKFRQSETEKLTIRREDQTSRFLRPEWTFLPTEERLRRLAVVAMPTS